MTMLQPCLWIVNASGLFRLLSPNHPSKDSHSHSRQARGHSEQGISNGKCNRLLRAMDNRVVTFGRSYTGD